MESTKSNLDASNLEVGASVQNPKSIQQVKNIIGEKNKYFESKNSVLYLSDAVELLKRIPAETVDLIVTDPAYSSMNRHLQLGKGRIVGEYKNRGENGKWFAEFEDSEENYSRFLVEAYRVMKPKSHIYIMFDPFSLLNLGGLFKRYFHVKNVLVWDKSIMGMGHYFRRQVEFILFCSKGNLKLTSRSLRDIWEIPRVIPLIFPSQKPVQLFENMITASIDRNNADFLVLDPFVGSGSSAIATLKHGGKFIGVDISSKALALSKERIHAYEKSQMDPFEIIKRKKTRKNSKQTSLSENR